MPLAPPSQQQAEPRPLARLHPRVRSTQSTGEARTAAYVAASGAGEDGTFDSFAEPASLVLSSFMESKLVGLGVPGKSHDDARVVGGRPGCKGRRRWC